MIYDRIITISAAGNRRSANWPPQSLLISELYERLRRPARGTESVQEYLALKKPQQDDLKDVGGFVAGRLKNGKRRANMVEGRDVLTLDLDSIEAGGTETVLRKLDGLGCGYCVYSTRKHRPDAPRLRVLFPLGRTAAADEYEPAARKAAELIDPSMKLFDPSTFEASRLMYWPSCCSDGVYVYQYADKPMLDPDGLLKMYEDWKNIASWPQVPGYQQEAQKRLAAKQGDPMEKHGVLGAFCRVYDIPGAMDAFLPGVYTPTESPNRFTFAGGTTTGGAVVYDNGKFLYSHHAHDPAGGRLCNAFDLVRLHLFGGQDDDTKPGTPANKHPSYQAMMKLAREDSAVIEQIDKEREEAVAADFSGEEDSGETPENPGWKKSLTRGGQNGEIENTIDNAWTILENDPLLRGKFALNEFANRAEVFGQLPWSKDPKGRQWEDNDNSGLYWYLEKRYHFTSSKKVDEALSLHSRRHSFNEVKNYLTALEWDGKPRLDTLFIDYLGAKDSEYTRAVTRKAFTAAVARAMEPGCKFDQMTVISGRQGIGKSTLLRKMGKQWFSDSVRDFSHIKETAELLQGVWIVEIGELGAMRSMDVNKVKQLMSQQADRFRAAYARHVKDCPRCCVFFGTSNDREYLQDKTGNRRFWPVDAEAQEPVKSVFYDLDSEVDQLWAEAFLRWQLGETLYLNPELEKDAREEQAEHRETSPWEGAVREFLEREVPADWNKRTLSQRMQYWNGDFKEDIKTAPRERVCAQEVFCEALDGSIKFMNRRDAIEINSIIEQTPGWVRAGKPLRFGYYGLQKGFLKE